MVVSLGLGTFFVHLPIMWLSWIQWRCDNLIYFFFSIFLLSASICQAPIFFTLPLPFHFSPVYLSSHFSPFFSHLPHIYFFIIYLSFFPLPFSPWKDGKNSTSNFQRLHNDPQLLYLFWHAEHCGCRCTVLASQYADSLYQILKTAVYYGHRLAGRCL